MYDHATENLKNDFKFMSKNPKVISYTRFSDPKQSLGTSASRQQDYAKKFAKEVGLPLDSTLSLKDEGLSAYHNHHIKKGALGLFLDAVENGHVARGSYLIIEALDRLTRTKPTDALGLLTQIVNSGITVVTASDGMQYSEESIDENPMKLLLSLMLMIRAHEESETKSRRVRDAIKIKCRQWRTIEQSGYINQGHDPDWVAREGDSFRLIPERVIAVKRIVELYQAGMGGAKIVDTLKAEGLSPSNKLPHAERIYRIVKSALLIGTKTIKVDDEEFILENYYPPVLSMNEYNKLQHSASKRKQHKAQNEIVGLFTGIGIAFCGYCGKAINGQNYTSRMRKDGTLADGHRRLICSSHNADRSCPVGGSTTIVPVEKAFLEFCTDKLQLEDLLSGTSEIKPLTLKRDSLSADKAKKQQSLENIIDAIANSGKESKALVSALSKLENEIEAIETELSKLVAEIQYLSNLSNPTLLEQWTATLKKIDAFDAQSRSAVAQLFAQTFERIEIFVKGFSAMTPDTISGAISNKLFNTLVGAEAAKKMIGVRLLSKNGHSRLLMINKIDYTWSKVVDVNFEEFTLERIN